MPDNQAIMALSLFPGRHKDKQLIKADSKHMEHPMNLTSFLKKLWLTMNKILYGKKRSKR
jgi:hypothetical protein